MLGFVDESGDTGFQLGRGSSDYFIISMVLFQDEEEVSKVDACIEALKVLQKRPLSEFHFAKESHKNRQEFFEAVKAFEFNVFALIVDKSRLQPFKHDDFLLHSFGVVMEEAKKRELLNNANLKFDDTGTYAFKKQLASALLAQVNKKESGKFIKQFSPQGSKGSNLIQLADMVCGAIARPYSSSARKKGGYLEIIKHRVPDESVLVWP